MHIYMMKYKYTPQFYHKVDASQALQTLPGVIKTRLELARLASSTGLGAIFVWFEVSNQ